MYLMHYFFLINCKYFTDVTKAANDDCDLLEMKYRERDRVSSSHSGHYKYLRERYSTPKMRF